jgi:peptidyl-prolyl cis-trans isomerase SurA
MNVGRSCRVGILAAFALVACRGAAPPLPPIPSTAGPILVRAGDPPPVRDGETVVDRVVAVVNTEIITMSELEEDVVLQLRDAKRTPTTEKELDDLRRQVLDRRINHRLQVQEARKEKIEVSDDDLRGLVEDFVRRNGGDREKLEAQLKAQGLSWDLVRRELREQKLAEIVKSRRVSRRATITEAEVDVYLAENRAKLEAGLKYHVRHIALLAEPPTSAEAWEKAKTEIDRLAGELRDGADFATLAREHSRDASASAGGDLGWLSRGELEPSFENPILSLPKGGVSAPVKSGVGYHLFKLEDREGLTAEMLSDARQQARDILFQRKIQERLDEWLEGLRRRALIAVRL